MWNFTIENEDVIEQKFISNSIHNDLTNIFYKSNSIKGVVPYWLIPYKPDSKNKLHEYSERLYTLLQNNESFFCVDINMPTNVDFITSAANDGCNFFIFALKKKVKEGLLNDMHKGLLHSKVMLMETGTDFDYILIGSHNQTLSALSGINIESSILLKIKSESNTKKSILRYLEHIKTKFCFEVPKNDSLEYWMLRITQTKSKIEEISSVNYVECVLEDERSFNAIDKDTIIHLIGFSDVEKIQNVRNTICLTIQNREASKRETFIATIQKSALNDPKNRGQSAKQSFGKRYFMLHGLVHASHRSLVTPTVIFAPEILNEENFYFSELNYELVITERVENLYSLPQGEKQPEWIDVWESEFEKLSLLMEQYEIFANKDDFNQFDDIKIINKKLLYAIFNSPSEQDFREEFLKKILEEKTVLIPKAYSISKDYIKMFRSIKDYIQKNSLLGKKIKLDQFRTGLTSLIVETNLDSKLVTLNGKAIRKNTKFLQSGFVKHQSKLN